MVPIIQIQIKTNTSVVFVVFSLGFCLSKDTKPNTHSQNEVVLLHYRGVYGVVETEIYFSDISPDRFSSSTQPRYKTVWYCLICTVPYLILRLSSFFNRFFVPWLRDYSDRTFLFIKNIYKPKIVIIIKYCNIDR